VLGFLLATSYQTQQRNQAALATPRKTDLINTVHKLEKERDKLKFQIEEERGQIAIYEKTAAENEGSLSDYTRALENVRSAAGLLQVKGNGLVVTLGDNQNYPKEDDPNNYVIHDYDIRLVVNSLFAGGAKAVSVNGQRLISTSSVRCAGGTILINSTREVTPYTIKAVGDPGKLRQALDQDDTTKRLLNEVKTFYGLQADVVQTNDISIPGYSGGLLIERAKVIEGGN
jgi:uncharacterized protein YlxW (UPF0749 family)